MTGLIKIDMNGKRNPWEAVNLLPFIDAGRLRAAVEELCPDSMLTKDELQRNSRGQLLEYRHDLSENRREPSCNVEIGLPDIPHCSCAQR
ncbi:unnamed protein product, partial [Discosporangium mesarthrocarpum]